MRQVTLPYNAGSTIAVTGQFKGQPEQTYHIPVHADEIGVCEVADRRRGKALILYKTPDGAWTQIGEVPVDRAVSWCDIVWSLTHCLADADACGPAGTHEILKRLRYVMNGSPDDMEVKL